MNKQPVNSKNFILSLLFLFLISSWSSAQSDPARDARMQWWREARFGMFIHWGPYAVLGGVYHGHQQKRGGAEWIMNRCKIPLAEYQSYAATFNPVNFDAEAVVRMAKDAGMKYIIITAKHHDGFAMFKSGASKFNIVDFTPYRKDILDMMANACRKYDMKLGFYYSQAQDWNNPGGAVARKVAAEGWANPDSTRIDAFTASHQGHWDSAQLTRSMADYIDQVAVPQVKELLSNYGDVAVFWWDTPTGMTDEYAEKLQDQLKQQPQIITNDRLKRPNFPGDTGTPEQKIPGQDELDGKDWETCMTMGSSWGYKSWDDKWKSSATLIQNLCDIASKGGNYLLNIGPDASGNVPQPSVDALKEIGNWMKENSEAIYATKSSPFGSFDWGRCTRKDDGKNTVLYFEVFQWPVDGVLKIPQLKNEIRSAGLLVSGTKLKTKTGAEGLTISLPKTAPDKVASVIKVELKGFLGQKDATGTKKMKTGELD